MAEGGEEEKNPYSFQNFIKSSGSPEAAADDESDDGPSPKNGQNDDDDNNDTPSSSDATQHTDGHSNGSKFEEKTSKREETSFSMKEFLRRDDGTRPKNLPPPDLPVTNGYATHAANYKTPVASTTSSKLPDFASGLPDFVQDHFYLEHTLRDSSPCSNENPLLDVDSLPDFTLSGAPSSLAEGNGKGGKREIKTSTRVNSPSRMKSRIFNCKGADNMISSSLPDFLSHGPLLSNHSGVAVDDDDNSMESPVTQEAACKREILKLQEENEALKRQLTETQEMLTAANGRIERLTRELQSTGSKENEDLNVLEKVVQQVENNLEVTMQRAVTAEAMVTKFKQEVKMLQNKVLLLGKENESLKDGNGHVRMIKEKASHTSQQITTAAVNAEQLLRQLLNGVDSLKLLASYLNDIDKVSEEDEKQDDIT